MYSLVNVIVPPPLLHWTRECLCYYTDENRAVYLTNQWIGFSGDNLIGWWALQAILSMWIVNISHFMSHTFSLETTNEPSTHFNLRTVVIVSLGQLDSAPRPLGQRLFKWVNEKLNEANTAVTYTHRSWIATQQEMASEVATTYKNNPLPC